MPRTSTTRGRTAGRTAVGRNSSRSSDARQSGGRGRMFMRGEEARNRVDEEIENQKNRSSSRFSPYNFRFYVKPGESRDIVILDEEPGVFYYEHNLKDPQTGKWNKFIPCIKAWDNCPLCDAVKESNYVMLLTIIDLTPYTNKDGQTVEWSRKLLVVKSKQQKKFIRKFEKEGSLRGAIFTMTRDQQMEASIGEDIEFDEFMDEEELSDFVREYTRDGKKETEDCSVPFNYEEIITEPTREQLEKLAGGDYSDTSSGNPERDRRRMEEEEEDEDGWEGDDKSNKPWNEDEEEDEEDGGEEEEEQPPSRRGRSATGRASRTAAEPEERPARSRRAARRSEPEPEPERPARSTSSRTRAAGRTRRSA